MNHNFFQTEIIIFELRILKPRIFSWISLFGHDILAGALPLALQPLLPSQYKSASISQSSPHRFDISELSPENLMNLILLIIALSDQIFAARLPKCACSPVPDINLVNIKNQQYVSYSKIKINNIKILNNFSNPHKIVPKFISYFSINVGACRSKYPSRRYQVKMTDNREFWFINRYLPKIFL